MRRRDFAISLLLAAATRTVLAQEQTKQHSIAIVASGPVARIHDPGNPLFGAFFEELRRLGDVEGQNLTVDAYSGKGRPAGYPDLAREVVNQNPDVIVVGTNPIALAVRAATGTIPIVWIGVEGIQDGLATSLAHPGGNITGVDPNDYEVWGKRLQILKEAVQSAHTIAFLLPGGTWERNGERLREMSRRLEISLIGMPLAESTRPSIQRAFADIAPGGRTRSSCTT
jgi:putative ABC transport system substrate-binding protein